MKRLSYLLWVFLFLPSPISSAKELPKIAVWDLEPRNTPDKPEPPAPVAKTAPEQRPSPPSGREIGRDGRFIAYNNGTVLDTRTNLMWAAKDNGGDITWVSAKSYCENYRGGGYTDWRMPTQDELAGLYDPSKSYKITWRDVTVQITELIQLSACCPWASETRGSDAAFLNFAAGIRWWGLQSNMFYGHRALPVRSGK